MSTATAPAPAAARIEEKLFQNRYRVDSERPHIAMKDPAVCADQCKPRSCTTCCPAGCWNVEGDGRVSLATDGCLECGTCRIVCTTFGNVAWEYPRGGYGILFKFG